MDGRGGAGNRMGRRRWVLRPALHIAIVLTALALTSAAASARPAAPRALPPAGPAGLVLRPGPPRAAPQVVLAEAHGLRLSGRPGALGKRPAPTLDSMDEADADALGDLPRRNVFLRGADCAWTAPGARVDAPVTLTFTLPKALFARSSLPLFRFNGRAWTRLAAPAVVGEVNTTASATITRPGRYALLLTTAWKVVTEDDEALVSYTGATPTTILRDPVVRAAGGTSDPAVVAATMEAAGETEEQAASTLRSFDAATTPVQVVTLTAPAVMERYWSGTSTVGRWFSPSGAPPLSPAEARRTYSLPAANTGLNVTLHLVKPGVALITGLCADMRDVSGYGPWATGGGRQYFGAHVSTYPPPLYDPAAITTLADLRWEKDAVDAIEW